MARAYCVKSKKKVETQNAKTIESKNGEAILVRPFSWMDLGKLRDMHSRCSPGTLDLGGMADLTGPRPSVTQVKNLLKWVLSQSKLLLSSIGWIRSILAVVPRGAYLSHVAVNRNDEIVGLRIHNILGRTRHKKYIVESLTVLRDDYQSRGLGTKFMIATLEMISPGVELVCSEIRRTNIKSLATSTSVGYTVIGTRKDKNGREYNVLVIHLPLHEARRPRDSLLASHVGDSGSGRLRS